MWLHPISKLFPWILVTITWLEQRIWISHLWQQPPHIVSVTNCYTASWAHPYPFMAEYSIKGMLVALSNTRRDWPATAALWTHHVPKLHPIQHCNYQVWSSSHEWFFNICKPPKESHKDSNSLLLSEICGEKCKVAWGKKKKKKKSGLGVLWISRRL